MDELRELIIEMKEENRKNFASIHDQLSCLRSDFTNLKTDVTDLSLSVDHLDNDLQVMKNETIPKLKKKLEDDIQSLKQQRLSNELYSKKYNLLFYGIRETDGENTEQKLRNFLRAEMGLDDNGFLFANVHRLPSRIPNKDKPATIIAKFAQMGIRNLVLNSATRLKNATQKYGISPHLPKEMQDQRSKLLTIKRQAISQGKRADLKTIGTEVKLYIDKKLWTP